MTNNIQPGLYEKDTLSPCHLTHIHHEILLRNFFTANTSTQSFINKNNKRIELSYYFSCQNPPNSIILELIDADGKKERLVAVIKGKEEAKERYDDSVAEGNKAMIVEKFDQCYLLQLGNIESGMKINVITKSIKKIEIENDDEDENMINVLVNIDSIVRIENDKRKIMSIKVDASDEEIKKVYSSSHPNSLVKREGYYEAKDLDATKDFMMTMKTTGYPISSCLYSKMDYKDYTYSGMLSILPNIKVDEQNNKNEFICIVDCSGSMSGRRMEQAKRALSLFFQSLDPEKSIKYNIIKFGTSYETLFDKSVDVSDMEKLKEAREYINTMSANLGGTDMLKPMKYVFGMEKKSNNIGEKIKKCKKDGVCTYKVTKKDYTLQKWYYCNECGYNGNSGVCEVCKDVCHDGHGCSESLNSPSNFYCDCGADGKCCKLTRKQFVPEEKNEDDLFFIPDNDGYRKQVFLFTDGEDEHPDEIVKLVKDYHEGKRIRVFSFGIGQGINKSFVTEVAEASKGQCCFIENINTEMKSKVLSMLNLASRPTIDNVKVVIPIECKALKVNNETKSMIFNGQLHSEYYLFKKPPTEIRLNYYYQKKKFTSIVKPVLYDQSDDLNVLVAKERINAITDKSEIKALGLKFSIITSETSFYVKSISTNKIVSELAQIQVGKKTMELSKSDDRLDLDGDLLLQVRSFNTLDVNTTKPKPKPRKPQIQSYTNGSGSGDPFYSFKLPSQVVKSQRDIKNIIASKDSLMKERECRSRRPMKKRKGKRRKRLIMKEEGECKFCLDEPEPEPESEECCDLSINSKGFAGECCWDDDSECPCEKKPQKAKDTKKKTFDMDKLLMLCNMRGVWTYGSEVCSILGISTTSVKKNQPGYVSESNLWISAVIVCFLQTYHQSKKAEWKLICKKTKRSLKSHKNIMKDAQIFLNSINL